MEYTISASSTAGREASLNLAGGQVDFGIAAGQAPELPSPAELFLGAFASCILKNVERFSGLLKFDYDRASLKVTATRLEKPPRMDQIKYELTVFSKDSRLNIQLLKKNIERYGTIYNTVSQVCEIEGTIVQRREYD